MSVENVIHKLVSEYTDGIAAAMRQRMHAVIDGIFEDAPESPKRVSGTPSRLPRRAAKGGRLKRRSIPEIDGLAGSVAALLADKGAMRAEQIRTALGLGDAPDHETGACERGHRRPLGPEARDDLRPAGR